MHPHRLAEIRSIELHRIVAELITADPTIIDRARDRVANWATTSRVPDAVVAAWSDLLAQPASVVAEQITVDDETMRDLRQNTPFAGVVDARRRWQMLRTTRAEADQGAGDAQDAGGAHAPA